MAAAVKEHVKRSVKQLLMDISWETQAGERGQNLIMNT
jgi:hypothetical protein